MSQSYNILLFDGFSNHCLANLVEPLRAANTFARRRLYTWRYFSLDGRPVESSSGLVVAPDGDLRDETGDVLVVMPSYGFLKLDTRETARALLHAAKKHRQLAGMDTGSWLLARAGLLDNHRATIHWDELSRFEETFPDVDAVQERFVIDRNRMTCSGAMAAFDLAAAIISQDHSPLLSMEVAHLLMSRTVANPYALPLKSDDTVVCRALTVMQAHIEAPISITEIARRIGCSQKTVQTRIGSELRTTPQGLYRRLRLALARKLAEETDQSIAEIAGRCGYENAGAMTRAFKLEFGQTPKTFRREARLGAGHH
ncbi:GlxA family transcriptional regulator [Yoonia sediminilitoris]|uniref:AraC family transcriptional regulator with amidase-like domain n=1 Tax=Yoonia sediminilitoris TaxID=1286148 RepID=A0A2T6K1B0_9RHOB|nr:helix-turn-helix domain-containing protein [Yoonia sediminilitoris]PUB08414.1 AraC family transcriptional regulator with amidase-like domain [Yoonia sediminilitoris]RCW89444.1 AraC family transcriptional regulator with amidase-like domain [Yoonia sediminilitoris]